MVNDVIEVLVGERAAVRLEIVALAIGAEQAPILVVHLAVVGVQGDTLALVARHAETEVRILRGCHELDVVDLVGVVDRLIQHDGSAGIAYGQRREL
jgi:hypothetical protein